VELKLIVDLVRNSLQCRYSAEVKSRQSIEQEAAGNSLFIAMFQSQHNVGGNGDEVDQYLSIDIVQSSRFINVLSWWLAQKESLSGHY
jgi:hypothetical protein